MPPLASTLIRMPSTWMGWRRAASTTSARAAASAGAGRPAKQHRELVAAEPGYQVALAGRRSSRSATCDQYLVAGGVAEGVVDLLEVVEVDQQQGGDAAACRAPASVRPLQQCAGGWAAR